MHRAPDIELSETLRKRLQKRVADVKFLLLGLPSRWILTDENRSSFDDLKTFCCFVGHGRSGGTLVGALLNAHPNIVMSNELNALRRLRIGLTEHHLYRLIYIVSKRQVLRGSMGGGGYSYAVAGQWQGKHQRLTVIGDRKAGATAYEIVRYPRLLSILDEKVKLDKKFVHVIRNPFDTITTTYHKTLPKSGETADGHLSREIRNYFARCTAVHQIEQKFGAASIHHLYHEQLIAKPAAHLQRVCEFLGVEPVPEYLRNCASIVMKSPHLSRTLLKWPDHQVAAVLKGMQDCHWLKSYTLNA